MASKGTKGIKSVPIPSKEIGEKPLNKKRSKKRNEKYSIYIYKVLKEVHPDTGVSSKAMSIMNSFNCDLFERLAIEASRLTYQNKTKTLTAREFQTALRLLLPGELARHAIKEGTKAMNKYSQSSSSGTD